MREDPELFAANQPASLARTHAEAIRDSGLAVYLEVGDHDALHLQDGAEFLHRVLWDLDISHEYHLVRGADHVGGSLMPRLREAFEFLGAILRDGDEADDGDEAVAALRRQLQPAIDQATEIDPTTTRRYGHLPTRA